MTPFRSFLAAVVTALALALGHAGVPGRQASARGPEHACTCCDGACACAVQLLPECGCAAVGHPDLPALPPDAPTPHHLLGAAGAARGGEPWVLSPGAGPRGGARPAGCRAVRFGNDFSQGRRRHGVLSVWRE